MKPTFHFKLPKDVFEDPFLFVRMLRERRAIQFDLGDISGLTPSEMYKITDVFVTHTHIDHFIGFDALLRVVLRKETPLNIYGPPNITACVAGKLRGYEWNLIQDYPLVINVFSFSGRDILHSVFRAGNRFRRETAGRTKSDGLLLTNPLYRVKTAKLSHGTACLAYTIEEEFHINIDKDRVLRKGLEVGPWLSRLKNLLRENAPPESTLGVSGKRYRLDELSAIATIRKGQKICFATDIALTRKNISALTELARGSDILFCEAYYLERDRELAEKRFHITAKTCGSIARNAGVRKLIVTHVSPKYRDNPDLVIQEAMDEFRR
jgi:ribonuclease Z